MLDFLLGILNSCVCDLQTEARHARHFRLQSASSAVLLVKTNVNVGHVDYIDYRI